MPKNISISDNLHRRLKIQATREGELLKKFIAKLLEQALKAQRSEAA